MTGLDYNIQQTVEESSMAKLAVDESVGSAQVKSFARAGWVLFHEDRVCPLYRSAACMQRRIKFFAGKNK